MFLTLTCPSYGRVRDDGTPADPAAYDYQSAARDALHFAALFDRFIQNLRRFLGYDAQYFAVIEPQRRLAPHVHIAIRGTFSRAELRQVLAATYHQVWWPPATEVKYPDGELPVWHEGSGNYVDPGHRGTPAHLGRGARCDRRARRAAAPGQVRDQVRRPGRARRITRHQPVHRLPDQVPHQAPRRLPPGPERPPARPRRAAGPNAQVRAVLAACANWLRYGIQPKNTRPGLRPGYCRGLCRLRGYADRGRGALPGGWPGGLGLVEGVGIVTGFRGRRGWRRAAGTGRRGLRGGWWRRGLFL